MLKLDDYTSECRVIDQSNEIWHVQVLNQKFKWLTEGNYVRIRQATLQNHKNYNKVFGLKSHSNILILPPNCKLSDNMYFDEKNESYSFEKELLTQVQGGANSINQPIAHPVILSRIDGQQAEETESTQITQLKQLIE